jgi:hypothetical protein
LVGQSDLRLVGQSDAIRSAAADEFATVRRAAAADRFAPHAVTVGSTVAFSGRCFCSNRARASSMPRRPAERVRPAAPAAPMTR